MEDAGEKAGTYVSRRRFLEWAGKGVAVGAVSLPVLAAQACSAPAPTAPSSARLAPTAAAKPGSVYPTYLPLANKPKPNYPSKGELYMDGYDNYPANPRKALPAEAPGAGGPLSVLAIGLYPPPSALEQNPAWQETNKQLNATVSFDIVTPSDFQTKMATTMAGNDPPDMMFCYYGGQGSQTALTYTPGLPRFLQSACADLTPYLAGDAIKDYPNLAAIPTYAWRNSGSVYQGRVQMVPRSLYSEGFVFVKNVTQWDQELGTDYVPGSADDFKRALLALTKPQEGRWGTASDNSGALSIATYAGIFGAPNNWRRDASGKLTKDFETEEWKAALGYLRDLWAAGVFHPNTLQYPSAVISRTDFVGGKWTVKIEGFATSWADPWRRARASTVPFEVHAIPPFGADSSTKPTHSLSAGHIGATALKKASPERIKEELRILNWVAAPFGSAEDLLLTAGVEGLDYNFDARGNPVLTDRGNPDANYVPWKFMAQRHSVGYLPDIPDYARVMAAAEDRLTPIGVSDPTLGVLSQTSLSKNTVLNQAVTDGTREIIIGRRPLSDFEQLLKVWRTSGGDQIRTEFQEALSSTG